MREVVALWTYQKLKKSLTSFSVVSWLMPLTLTVLELDMIAVFGGDGLEVVVCVEVEVVVEEVSELVG